MNTCMCIIIRSKEKKRINKTEKNPNFSSRCAKATRQAFRLAAYYLVALDCTGGAKANGAKQNSRTVPPR